MQVGHGLLSGLADVGDHPVARPGEPQFLRKLRDDGEDVAHHGGALLCDGGDGLDVLLGHHQEVGGSLGGDVVESIAQIVFVDLAAGNLPGNDFTE